MGIAGINGTLGMLNTTSSAKESRGTEGIDYKESHSGSIL